LDLYLRSWEVADTDKLLPSNAAPYMDAEPMKRNATTKAVDRDSGVGDYPVILNYDPPGLAENQTVGKTTTLDGGTFYAWIHPDCFDQDLDAPAAGDMLMCGPIEDALGAVRAYNGFRKLGTVDGVVVAATYFCVGQYEYTETRQGIDYLYCRLDLVGDQVAVS
jgi:hypothetical protein